MYRVMVIVSIVGLLLSQGMVFADENVVDNSVVKEECTEEVVAPKWEEYVPYKYQNPRNFGRGKSIAELSTGIFLTDLLITAPIGVPMIVHSTTKLKNKSYYDKKIKFEQGLAEAEKITNPEEKKLYYNRLLKDCKMTEEMRAKQLKKIEKRSKRDTTEKLESK